MADWRHGFAIIMVPCLALAPSAQACSWQLKVGRDPPKGAGIVCTPGQTEYQIATLNCEYAPLHLDLEGDCGAERVTCRVRFMIDRTQFDVVGTNDPIGEIWDGFIEMPIANREDLTRAFVTAKHIDVSVEDGPSWRMPSQGLAEAVGVLLGSCAAPTS